MQIPVLFADTHYVVLNKPQGLPVHAGPSGGASVEDCFPTLSRRKDGPWLVHRLDADTAGCLVVALRKAPLIAAQATFAAGTVGKLYWAVVRGGPAEAAGTIEAPLRKMAHGKGWRVVVDAAGQRAVTTWEVLGRSAGLTWLGLSPRTGRTHQIRVHCASAGWPIMGDALYGTGGEGLHLLARSISVPVQPVLQATAPPPRGMHDALRACGWQAGFTPA